MAELKKSTLLPTAFFPSLNYCRLLLNSESVIVDLGEHFIKQSIRNRCCVLGPNGILKLIVPVEKWRNNTPVKDIKVSYSDQWEKQHWKTLESCYRSSPYFEYYEDKLRPIFFSKHKYLKDLNQDSLNFIGLVLHMENEFLFSQSYIDDDVKYNDHRSISVRPNGEKKVSQSYIQVFPQNTFIDNLSFIDLICNEGPNAIHLLE